MSLLLAMMILHPIGYQDQPLLKINGLDLHLMTLMIGKLKMKNGKVDQRNGGFL